MDNLKRFKVGDRVWWHGNIHTVSSVEYGGYNLEGEDFAYESELADANDITIDDWESDGGS